MKFYTVEIKTVNGQTTQAIFERADLDTAKSAYHYFMSSAMSTEGCTHVLCMVINSDGGTYVNDSWHKEANERDNVFVEA